MRATVDGQDYRLIFKHEREYAQLPDIQRARDGSTRTIRRKVPIVFYSQPDQPPVQAVTRVAVVRGHGTSAHVLVQGRADCAATEPKGFDKEYGRQAALARALVQLPRRLAGPVLGAYMASGKRAALPLAIKVNVHTTDLHGTRQPGTIMFRIKTLADALRYCPKEVA